MTRPLRFKHVRPLIKHILLRDWDPIGVAEHPEAQDEYDTYVPAVFQLLAAGASEQGLADHLKHIELSQMGISGAEEPRQSAARALLSLVDPATPMADIFPCPACGFLTFNEPPGSYAICDVCGWEDDAVQLRYPALRGGANRLSLAETQRHWLAHRPREIGAIKGYARDPAWRPILDDEWERARASLSPEGGLPPRPGLPTNDALYYWLAPRPRAG